MHTQCICNIEVYLNELTKIKFSLLFTEIIKLIKKLTIIIFLHKDTENKGNRDDDDFSYISKRSCDKRSFPVIFKFCPFKIMY